MPANAPLLVTVPLLLLAAGVSAWVIYEGTPDMTDISPDIRPVPIRDAFKSVGAAIAFAGSVLVSLVGYGVLDQAQADAATNLLGLIPGAITAVTAVLMAFGVRASAEPKVTPAEDPRDQQGRPLAHTAVAGTRAAKRTDPPTGGVVADGDTWTS